MPEGSDLAEAPCTIARVVFSRPTPRCPADSSIPLSITQFYAKRAWLHGHRIRSDRHRTDAGKGSLREAVEDRSHRRTVPAVRRIRPDREGRGGFLRGDRKVGRVEDPFGRRREGDQDAGPRVLLVTAREPSCSPPACYHRLVVTARSIAQLSAAGILRAAGRAEDHSITASVMNDRIGSCSSATSRR